MPSLVAKLILNPILRPAQRLCERRQREQGIQDDRNTLSDSSRARRAQPVRPGTPVPSEWPFHPPVRERDRNRRPLTAITAPVLYRRPTHVFDSMDELQQTVDSEAARATVNENARSVAASPPRRKQQLPEDDGMGAMRRRVLDIQTRNIPQHEKARLLHEALMEGYRKHHPLTSSKSASQPATWSQASPGLGLGEAGEVGGEHVVPTRTLESLKFWQSSKSIPGDAAPPGKFDLTEDDIRPTHAPPDTSFTGEHLDGVRPLGCKHYRRNVKLQCSTCAKWYTCRFCHDAVESHNLIRKETQNMLCMLCGCPQRAAESCANCKEPSARYFCGICKLWDDHPNKNIYHCNDCGICRRGQGLGKDFFHCKKCCACISIAIQDSHKCIERSTDCDCPICGEYMFTSPKPVVFMVCGHSIHSRCYDQHMKTSYKCPICNKSLLNMESQFRQLDLAIQDQPMPAEFRDTRSTVLCNDCNGKSTVLYHWLGLKCAICNSYNTVELSMRSRSNIGGTEMTEVPSQRGGSSLLAPPMRAVTGQRGLLSVPRRRFSSIHAPDLEGTQARRNPDDRNRMARSASPPSQPHPLSISISNYNNNNNNNNDDGRDDSDEDMFGLWTARARPSSEGDVGDHDDDELEGLSSEEDDEEEEEEENDDGEEDIFLIGHR